MGRSGCGISKLAAAYSTAYRDVSGGRCSLDNMVQVADGRYGRIVSNGNKGGLANEPWAPLRVWDLTTGTCTLQPTTHKLRITCLVALADGRIASAGFNGSLQVFDLAGVGSDDWLSFTTELVPRSLKGASRRAFTGVTCMLGLADGRLMTACPLRVWDLETGTCTQHLHRPHRPRAVHGTVG